MHRIFVVGLVAVSALALKSCRMTPDLGNARAEQIPVVEFQDLLALREDGLYAVRNMRRRFERLSDYADQDARDWGRAKLRSCEALEEAYASFRAQTNATLDTLKVSIAGGTVDSTAVRNGLMQSISKVRLTHVNLKNAINELLKEFKVVTEVADASFTPEPPQEPILDLARSIAVAMDATVRGNIAVTAAEASMRERNRKRVIEQLEPLRLPPYSDL